MDKTKTTETRHMTGLSLHGDPEKSLCEHIKENPGSSWSLQDFGYARVLLHLLKKAAIKEWNQSKLKKYIAVHKIETSWIV